mmetsp:Transcript_588/g.1878  ORF Transcript_588/g.1878 Transcript_588/m.1878 type:complete len:236 (-) Transcript_588:1572-2279(-)
MEGHEAQHLPCGEVLKRPLDVLSRHGLSRARALVWRIPQVHSLYWELLHLTRVVVQNRKVVLWMEEDAHRIDRDCLRKRQLNMNEWLWHSISISEDIATFHINYQAHSISQDQIDLPLLITLQEICGILMRDPGDHSADHGLHMRDGRISTYGVPKWFWHLSSSFLGGRSCWRICRTTCGRLAQGLVCVTIVLFFLGFLQIILIYILSHSSGTIFCSDSWGVLPRAPFPSVRPFR